MEPWRLLAGVGEDIPLRSESFEVVYSCNVLEHAQNPKKMIEEAIRVLKPGRVSVFRNPQLWLLLGRTLRPALDSLSSP